jgi:signal transduction histidine kinase
MAERLRKTMAELAQREALAAVGSFASELAHEVRNPLTSIKVDLQFVEEQLPNDGELRGVQRSALAQVDRLDQTISGVLQIARSGQIVTEPLDIREPLSASVNVMESVASQLGASVCLSLPDSPLTVRGDRNALQRLFTNLLANAAQAVSKGGTVTVRASSAHDDVVVTVRDDGPGIPPDRLPRVREPFYSTRPDGTGLGLAIADRIAAAHRATVSIESEPGLGTEVTVRIPRGPVAEHAPRAPADDIGT